jgi:hypothetical protein
VDGSVSAVLAATAFGSVSHQVHRPQRASVSPYFSRASVRKLQGEIWERDGHMCSILRGQYQENRNRQTMFLIWSNDRLRNCAFSESLNLLDDLDRAMAFDRAFKAFAAFYPIVKQ